MTAIVGFAESFSAPEVLWSLIGRGFGVRAFARKRSRSALRFSRYASIFDLTPPEEDAAATVRELTREIERLLQANGTRLVLLALDDAAIWVFSRIPPDERIVIVGRAAGTSEFALKKDLQISVARGAGFSIPETLVLQEEHKPVVSTLALPLILKPGRAISLRDDKLTKERFYVCSSKAEVDSAIRGCQPGELLLAQQYISGCGEGLFGVATQRGVMAWSAHRRIRMMNPLGSGASACVSVAPNAADIASAVRLIDRIQWRGPFMIELLRDAAGRAWFMEFNGRIWGSTALARRCGLEYPAWGVMEAIGQQEAIPQKPQTITGVVCRHAGRETLHALFILRGPRSQLAAQWPSRWRTLAELLKFRKSQRWYNWRQDDWRVFATDLVFTIAEVFLKRRR